MASREAIAAGANDTTRAATAVAASAKASARPSTRTSAIPGTPEGPKAAAARTAPIAIIVPARPAASASSALSTQLVEDDLRGGGAERSPDGQVGAPADGLHQQEDGHVRAGQEQDAGAADGQRLQGLAGARAEVVIDERDDGGGIPAGRPRTGRRRKGVVRWRPGRPAPLPRHPSLSRPTT